ncbi:thioredoxin family protein [Castellaniella caeni]|uniref:thioredoxin family protein n=1 Tax=Castellaniella caeni TaxID=266123 RepID=UPI0008329331|nr:thioredoxin family protein [Castellaniella caeni]
MELYNPHTDLAALRARLAQDQGRRVVCYCAAWCRTCDAYQPALRDLAARMPDWTFIWVDVEDAPDWLGDEEVENFPTVLVQDREGTRFWGVQLPYIEHLLRLLEGATRLPATDTGPGRIDTLAQAE